MKFKKLLHCTDRVPKVSGFGKIGYQLWADEENNYGLYIQLIRNVDGGTHTNKLLSLAQYAPIFDSENVLPEKLAVYDPETGQESTVEGSNNRTFFEAVLNYLLSDDA